jgi:hypothetical protein
MALADGSGLPLAVCAASASPHEVTLVGATLEAKQEETQNPGRAQAQALQEALEDRAALRLAAQLPSLSGPIRAVRRELPRLGEAGMHRHPAEVFVRWVLGKCPLDLLSNCISKPFSPNHSSRTSYR